MKTKLLLLILLFPVTRETYSQDKIFNDYFSIIKSQVGTFVYSKPNKIEFSRHDTTYISWQKKEPEYKNVQWPKQEIITQLFKNCENYDSTYWSNKEIPLVVIVNDRTNYISYRKFKVQNPGLQDSNYSFLKKEIRKWNYTESNSRKIYFASRPVFDDKKDYAIIQVAYYCGNLCGKVWIILYKIENNKWHEIGYLKSYVI